MLLETKMQVDKWEFQTRLHKFPFAIRCYYPLFQEKKKQKKFELSG